ncbi:MAG: zinc-ribbon domain-containing protein [Myxococcota bacterium]|nr:zinc-ribbon domain-containing protein [Myxococcota bacterium]MDW8362491.1 GYF domain-containing protein [Myxococcales bacterium]
MKIVCDSCGAKYSIADEKVAGKVFKIRCKKCQAVIIVRGDQPAASEAPAAQPPADAVWHVVVQGEQQGPFTVEQIGEMLGAGTIDWDAYVWREGFDDWLVARDVPELVEAITGQAATRVAAGPQGLQGGVAATADPFASSGGGGADPFAGVGDSFGGAVTDSPFAQAPAPAVAAGAAPRPARAGKDVFASASAFEAAGGSDDDVVASAPSPRLTPERMTGQRNENSVLFSLANLQALATGGSAPATASVGAARPGQAGGEGSGLIDIRALASATSSPATAARKDAVDDLLSIGTGSPLGSALGAPVLAPVVQEPKSNRTVLYAVVGAAAVVAIAAIAIIAVLLSRPSEPSVAQAPVMPPSGTAPSATNSITGPGAVAPTGASGEAMGAAGGALAAPSSTSTSAAPPPTTAPQAAATEREESERTGGGRGSRRRGGGGEPESRGSGSSSSSPTAASEPAPSAAGASSMASGGARSSGGGGGGIDELLDRAIGGAGTSMASPAPTAMAPPSQDSDLPEQPTREVVLNAMRAIQDQVAACGQGQAQRGTAMTNVTVSGATGRVTGAEVTGQFAGTPVGSCVARAVRGARFPRFRRDTFSFSFPFRI